MNFILKLDEEYNGAEDIVSALRLIASRIENSDDGTSGFVAGGEWNAFTPKTSTEANEVVSRLLRGRSFYAV